VQHFAPVFTFVQGGWDVDHYTARSVAGEMMTRDQQLLRYYWRRLGLGQKVLAETPEHDRQRVYFARGYLNDRVILQRLIEKTGEPICHGAVDCIAPPTTTCITTEHSSCPGHIYSCYLCVSLGEASTLE